MTVHGDHAVADAGFSYPSAIITVISGVAMTFAFVVAIPCYYMWYDLPPEFSVQLRANGIIGPNRPSISISNAFNVTLRADNRRATGRCYRHGEAVVTYAGFTVASTRTPDLCVPRKQTRVVPFRVAWDDWVDGGVGLPEHLSDRFAAAEKVGAVELEVQLRLIQGDDRPVWMWCKVTMGTAGAQQSPCSVFGLQNWLSDWPRALMQ